MKTILVADHDPRIQQLIRKFLEPEGYEVLTVGDGIEALEKFRQNRINLLITYVMMPEMGGFELINAIQTDRFLFPEPRILILTAEPNTRDPAKDGRSNQHPRLRC